MQKQNTQKAQSQVHTKQGDQMFADQPKINSELLTLTYGVFVAKLIQDADDNSAEEVNQQLEKAGYNMGCRMIDDFFARQKQTQQIACKDFQETMNVVAK